MKTRTEELIELLDPHGQIVVDVHDAIMAIKNENDPLQSQVCWKTLDIRLERYVQLRIEQELLKRRMH